MPKFKGAIKKLADLIALLAVSPALIAYRLGILVWPSRRDLLFQDAGQALSLVPGLPGVFMRRAFYRQTLQECANSVWIGFGTLLTKSEASLGENVYIGSNCTIGMASIGADVLLGSNVDIPSGKSQHGFDDPDTPIRLQAGAFERIRIGSDVWVGNGSIILADVGEHAVVAAGGVVVKLVEPWTIVGGNPARVIGQRRVGAQESELRP